MGETSASFKMNKLLYEATILEQQLSYYVLEGEYNEEAGVVTEGLKEAGVWIKDKIDKFINFIRKWFGIIADFITKKFPAWVKRRVDGLLELLHIRQKPAKVDENKISDKNKPAVKEAVKQASKANIVIAAAGKKAGEETAPKLQNINNKDTSDVAATNGDEAEKNDISKNIVKQAEEVREKAVEKLEKVKENSSSQAEKAEVDSAIKNIEAGQQVELSTETSDKLQGKIIDIDVAFKQINGMLKICKDMAADTRIDARFLRMVGRRIDRPNIDANKFNDAVEDTNDTIKDIADRKKSHIYYREHKKQNKISLDIIMRTRSERTLSKKRVEKALGDMQELQKTGRTEINDIKRVITDGMIYLNKYKESTKDTYKNIDHSNLQKAISVINMYIRDVTECLNDYSNTTVQCIKDLEHFLVAAKPVK